jgi:hypothetical protein
MTHNLTHRAPRRVAQRSKASDVQPSPELPVSAEATPPTQSEPDDAVAPIVEVIEYPTAPDVLPAVRTYEPGDHPMKTMSAYSFPVFLKQALEVIARDAERPMEHAVGAILALGLPILRRVPGIADCQSAREALLHASRDPYVRLWLEQIVPVDMPTAGLGHTRFVVRIAVGRHRQIGQLAAALGLPNHQCFTLTLTAVLIGSPYVPMSEANDAMYRTLIDFRDRCVARAGHAEMLRSAVPTEAAQPRWTIAHVLGG